MASTRSFVCLALTLFLLVYHVRAQHKNPSLVDEGNSTFTPSVSSGSSTTTKSQAHSETATSNTTIQSTTSDATTAQPTGSNTTTSGGTSTPVPMGTSQPVTTTGPTTHAPTDLTISYDKQQHFASDTAVVNCSFASCKHRGLGPWITLEKGHMMDVALDLEQFNESCFTVLNLRAFFFVKQRVQVLLKCEGGEERTYGNVTFQRSLLGESCFYDVDCWDFEQICENGKCKCSSVSPSFVKSMSRCFPGAEYGRGCIYDEQCQQEDSNSHCKDHICDCIKNYRVTNETSPICSSGTLAMAILSRTVFIGTVVFATSFFARHT